MVVTTTAEKLTKQIKTFRKKRGAHMPKLLLHDNIYRSHQLGVLFNRHMILMTSSPAIQILGRIRDNS